MTRLFEAFAKDGVIVLPERVPQPANLNDRYHLSARGVWIMAQAYPPK